MFMKKSKHKSKHYTQWRRAFKKWFGLKHILQEHGDGDVYIRWCLVIGDNYFQTDDECSFCVRYGNEWIGCAKCPLAVGKGKKADCSSLFFNFQKMPTLGNCKKYIAFLKKRAIKDGISRNEIDKWEVGGRRGLYEKK